MPDSPQLQQLLDQLIDAQSTPEEVCSSFPELLEQVRQRWREITRAQAELDELFPPVLDSEADIVTMSKEATRLPIIPGYIVESVLGRGGMGIVFRARQLALNRVVALKMTLAGAFASARERERFQNEAVAVAGLQHPNIVQIHDVDESDGLPFFTMEFVDGGSLAQKLAGHPQPPRQASVMIAQLADAVASAHHCGIVHRDLKPANVLLSNGNFPKISDFGLAKRLNTDIGLTHTGAVLGTPSYMAPEQATGGRDHASAAVDIYALGAILYELLTGRPPFQEDTVAETLQQVIYQDPIPPSRLAVKVPKDLEIICLKCLHKEPHLRYSTAPELRDDLNRFLRGEAITARVEGRVERLLRQIRRRPMVSAVAAGGILVGGGLLGVGGWLISERAAVTRQTHADRIVAETAADDKLREMVDLMSVSAWSEARTSLERAIARLGPRGSSEFQERIVKGKRDLELAAELESIRLTGFERVASVLDFTTTDARYERAFRESGLWPAEDSPKVVAVRVQKSHIQNALLAALDHWSVCTADSQRKLSLAELFRFADAEQSGWRERSQDSTIWKDEKALFQIIETAPHPEQAVPRLLAMELTKAAEGKLRVRFLKRVHARYPRDFWVNLRLADTLMRENNFKDAVGFYQVAQTIRPGVAIVHNNLGISLTKCNRFEEAAEQFRITILLDQNVAIAHESYAQVLSVLGLHEDAIRESQIALNASPDHAVLHVVLARSYKATDRPEDALAHYRRSIEIEPTFKEANKELRELLIQSERWDEARTAWARQLDSDPLEHEIWYGYAELCVFLEREEDYVDARRKLLAKFGGEKNPVIAERIIRACSLRPAVGEELNRIVKLAEQATEAARAGTAGWQPYFKFARGLVDLRQGHIDEAINTMRGEAAGVLGPAPQLVLAMSLLQKGQSVEAGKILAAGVSSHDWRATQVKTQDDWIYHSLRREAEFLLLPDFQALLEGKQTPRDNEERLILLGACQFAGRFRMCAQLYADVFVSDPNVTKDISANHLFNAARMSALAGCGFGIDVIDLDESEKRRLRSQARQWLHAILTDCRTLVEKDHAATREWVRWMLTRCRESSDFAGLRDPKQTDALSSEERTNCDSLWYDVATLFALTEVGKHELLKQ